MSIRPKVLVTLANGFCQVYTNDPEIFVEVFDYDFHNTLIDNKTTITDYEISKKLSEISENINEHLHSS